MIKNIVFDMGNVLIEYNPDEIMKKYKIVDQTEKEQVLKVVFNSVEWVQTDRGTISDDEALVKFKRGLPENIHTRLEEMFKYWHENRPIIEGMSDIIKSLKDNGYKLYLLSNASQRYHEIRKYLPEIDLFEGEFVSSDWHINKPDLQIFKTFCTYHGVAPRECFFIDDSPANIEAAMYMGMSGFVFRGNVLELKEELKTHGINVD